MTTSQPTLESVAAILTQLTTPDTTLVRQAEHALNQLLVHPSSITPLSQVLCANPAPAQRHIAAVVLRRALPKHWGSLSNETRSSIKSSLLPRLSSEPDPAPRRGLIFLTAAICRIEDNLWPELNAAALQLANSETVVHRAASFYVFQALSDFLPLKLSPHLETLVPVFAKGLEDADLSVRISALDAFEAAIGPASINEGGSFDAMTGLLPNVVAVATSYEDTMSDEFGRVVCSVFDILTFVMEMRTAKVKEYFQDAVRFGLRVLVANGAAQRARSAATEFVVGVLQEQPRAMRKHGLALLAVQSACKVVFDNAAFAGEHGAFGHDDDDAEEEEVAAIRLSLRLLDALARRPELSKLVFMEVMAIVSRTFEAGNVLEREARDAGLAAGYRVIGAICGGCSEEVTVHGQEVVKKLIHGAFDSNVTYPTVARAIEALGLACEALNADEMPDKVTAEIANTCLSAVLGGMRHPELFVRRHACMSLEPAITLFNEDTTVLSNRVEEVIEALGGLGKDAAVEAVMAVGVIAEHATEAFVSSEKYEGVIEGIIRLISQRGEKDLLSRVAALEAAGAIVSACEDQSVIETLASHAIQCLEVDDPTCKHATYSFFARMADAVGGSVVAVFGTRVLTSAIQSMEREEISTIHDEEDEDSTIGDMIGKENDEPFGPGSFQVRTAYLEEKMVATACVGSFGSATATKSYIGYVSSSIEAAHAIRDLLSRAIKVIADMSLYFHEDVRASAYRAHSRMAGANVTLMKKHPVLAFAGPELLKEAFTKLVYGMQEDSDIWVVSTIVGSASTFMGLVPADVVAENKTSLLDGIHSIISGQATCQAKGEEDSLDGLVADFDEGGGNEVSDLLEAVGDVIEAMSHALRGYFAQDFPLLLTKMMDNLYSDTGSLRNKGTVLGAVSGVLLFMNWDRCTQFNPPATGSAEYELALAVSDDTGALLLPYALTAIRSSESKTLTRNAIFLIGIIFSRARATRSDIWQLLPQSLALFQEILAAGKNVDGALVDNAAGAVARIVTSNGCPKGALGDLGAILQAILGPIPLQHDPTENTTIARALIHISISHFEDLLNDRILQSVLSCLVSAGLLYHGYQVRQEYDIRHDVSSEDPNDRMTLFDEQEFFALASLMSRIRGKVGDEPFKQLGLPAEDEVVLGRIMQANGNK